MGVELELGYGPVPRYCDGGGEAKSIGAILILYYHDYLYLNLVLLWVFWVGVNWHIRALGVILLAGNRYLLLK